MHRIIFGKTVNERRLGLKFFKDLISKVQSLESLESLSCLQSLENLQRLEILNGLADLEESKIKFTNQCIFGIDYSNFDCVYFEIPYKGTARYIVKTTIAKNQAITQASILNWLQK